MSFQVIFKPAIWGAIFLVVLPLTIRATHIVGGEMNYTCLGNNEYEITLTIFRDCYNGNPNAWFDNPASIGVFDAQNNLLQEVLVPLMNNDTLDPVLTSECLVVPPNVCVHTTTYRTVINLPPITGGYQLAYQRCCRNQTIVNIVDPLDTGATYGVTISERALEECNSNPKFQQWPPIYICVNEPIVFDQSAIDQDGDGATPQAWPASRRPGQTIALAARPPFRMTLPSQESVYPAPKKSPARRISTRRPSSLAARSRCSISTRTLPLRVRGCCGDCSVRTGQASGPKL